MTVVMWLIVRFFVGFRIDSSDDKVRFDIVIISNHNHVHIRKDQIIIMSINMLLQI